MSASPDGAAAAGEPSVDPTARTTRTYDRVAPSYLARWRERSKVLPALERFAAALPPRASVLDLGCGPGFDAAWLRARGCAAFGLDRSLGMLRSGGADYAVPRIQGDMRHLPLAASSLDAVWASASLHHLPRAALPAALAELARVLRPGGLLYLSLKRGRGEAWLPAPYGQGGPRFYSFWQPGELEVLLASAGFAIEQRESGARRRPGAQPWLGRLVRRV